MKPKQYTIVSGPTIPDLNTVVNEFMDDGWHPQGGVAISQSSYSDGSMRDGDGSIGLGGTTYEYAQAMIK